MTKWENFSSSVTFHGCQQVDGIRGFRIGYLAGKIDQLSADHRDVAPYMEQLNNLEKEWGVAVSFEAFPSTWK